MPSIPRQGYRNYGREDNGAPSKGFGRGGEEGFGGVQVKGEEERRKTVDLPRRLYDMVAREGPGDDPGDELG